jgi:hypothetical protein
MPVYRCYGSLIDAFSCPKFSELMCSCPKIKLHVNSVTKNKISKHIIIIIIIIVIYEELI